MDAADGRAIAAKRERAERALEIVRRDLLAQVSEPVELRIDMTPGGSMWVTDASGSAYGETVSADDDLEALASVASDAQTVVMEEIWRTWPDCPTHDAGLHVDMADNAVIWWCRAGQHAVAKVGELPHT